MRQCLYNISSWVGCFCYNQVNLIIVLLLLEFGSKHFGWFNYFSKIFHLCFFCTQRQQQTAQEQLFFCIIWHQLLDKTEVCDSDRIIAQEIYCRIFSDSCSWNHRSFSSSIMLFLPIGVLILNGFYFLKDVSKSLAHVKNIITNKKHWVLLKILTFHFPTCLPLFMNLPVKGNYSIVTRHCVTSSFVSTISWECSNS